MYAHYRFHMRRRAARARNAADFRRMGTEFGERIQRITERMYL